MSVPGYNSQNLHGVLFFNGDGHKGYPEEVATVCPPPKMKYTVGTVEGLRSKPNASQCGEL